MLEVVDSYHIDNRDKDTNGESENENRLLARGQAHAGENRYRQGEDSQIGYYINRGGADEFGEQRYTLGAVVIGGIPSGGSWTALEDVHQGEDDASKINNGEGKPRCEA